MNTSMTHERCSELLLAHVTGELGAEQRNPVEEHLAHCAQCSAERRALIALTSEEGEALTGDERVALRASVLSAAPDFEPASRTLTDEQDAVIVPFQERSGTWSSRAGKYVGIAAMLALLAVGFVFVNQSGGGFGGGADDTVGGGSSEAADTEGEADEDSRDTLPETTEDAQSEDEGVGSSSPTTADDGAGPIFQSDRGALSSSEIGRLGTRAFSKDSRLNFESPREGGAEIALERLSEAAPQDLAATITACGRTALNEFDEPGVPAYGTTATVDGQRSLIIGFVTDRAPPDRYLVVAFPLDDCTTILESSEGPLP